MPPKLKIVNSSPAEKLARKPKQVIMISKKKISEAKPKAKPKAIKLKIVNSSPAEVQARKQQRGVIIVNYTDPIKRKDYFDRNKEIWKKDILARKKKREDEKELAKADPPKKVETAKPKNGRTEHIIHEDPEHLYETLRLFGTVRTGL